MGATGSGKKTNAIIKYMLGVEWEDDFRIFGKDIGENVRFLVTFAYGDQPPVLEAIKEAK